jgi:polysaccharide biosynthesis protein PelC
MALLSQQQFKIMKTLQLLLLLLLFTACTTVVHDEGKSQLTDVRLVMPPFVNATDNEHAAEGVTQLTGSALLKLGIPLYQTEQIVSKAGDETTAKPDARFLQIARENKAAYLLIGTVHEYRYKSDLTANPAVGITLRLVAVEDGRTIWQGSSSTVGRANSSLTATAQRAVRDLVSRIPLKTTHPSRY